MKILVDVIQAICDTDSETYLKESINSILGQTYPISQYIIVKDGPLPRRLEKILISYSNRLTLLQNIGRKGLAGSLNTAIRYSDADFLVRMDSDDISEINRIQRLMDEFDSDPDLLVIGSGAKEIDWKGNIFFTKQMPKTKDKILKMAPTRPPFIHVSTAFRRTFFDLVGEYDDRYYKAQDYELWARTIIHYPQLLKRMRNIDDPLINVRLPQNFWSKRAIANVRYGTRVSLRLIHHMHCYHRLIPLFFKMLLRISPKPVKRLAYQRFRA